MQQDLYVIVGLGVTGLSCARYLSQKNIPFAVTDTRLLPPQLAEFKQRYPDVLLSLGKLDERLLQEAHTLVVSPGVSLKEPALARQIANGTPVIGDIELFARESQKPLIAITGTNAKSTVTTLVGEMAARAGFNVKVGGNLGVPALDLLQSPDTALFILELSSFQLETTFSLSPVVSTVLNITPDHMDRYATFDDYCQAKQRIYSNCQVAVCNRDDARTDSRYPFKKEKLQFTLSMPNDNEFGLVKQKNLTYLAYGNQVLMPTTELPIVGQHYQANALAALAIGHGFGFHMSSMLETLRLFKGLPHRCQLVREREGVYWYNDSKGTNVGATLAAVEGLGSEVEGKLILIAGGISKSADFSPLMPSIEKYVKTIILIGEAAPILASMIGNRVDTQFAQSMEEAVFLSDKAASAGDSVLLSPACASFDMFKNFEHRGNVFMEIVKAL